MASDETSLAEIAETLGRVVRERDDLKRRVGELERDIQQTLSVRDAHFQAALDAERDRDTARAKLAAAERDADGLRTATRAMLDLIDTHGIKLLGRAPGGALLGAIEALARAARGDATSPPEPPAEIDASAGDHTVIRRACGCIEHNGVRKWVCPEHLTGKPPAEQPREADEPSDVHGASDCTNCSGDGVIYTREYENPVYPCPMCRPWACEPDPEHQDRAKPADEPHGPTLAAALDIGSRAMRAAGEEVSGPLSYALRRVADNLDERAAKVRAEAEGGKEK